MVKVNQRAKFVSQKPFSSKVIVKNNHPGSAALPGSPKWTVPSARTSSLVYCMTCKESCNDLKEYVGSNLARFMTHTTMSQDCMTVWQHHHWPPWCSTLAARAVSLLIYKCLHQAAPLIWLRCEYQSQQFSGDMVYGQQYVEIWRSHDVIWQDMDNGASTSLDHHCGTLCHWLFVIRHWL